MRADEPERATLTMLFGLKNRDSVDPCFEHNLGLLARLIRGADGDTPPGAEADGARSGAFTRFIERYQLQLLVNWLLTQSKPQQFLLGRCLGEIKAYSLDRWVAQEKLVRELARLSALLTAAGHEFILLKGPYLAARFFGGIDRRVFHDLDILVRGEQVPAVERLLRDSGYIRKSTVLINESLTARFTHAFDFTKSEVALDLHWLLSANAGHRLDYNAIWNQRQNFLLRNQHYFVLSDEYQVVFTLISIFKDIERGAAGLKQFVDLYFILSGLSGQFEWRGFLERRRREKILRITVNVLALFLDLFDCHDRFPDASHAIARERRLIKDLSPEYRRTLIEAAPGALKNKVWAAGLYDCSRAHVFFWWLTSLPFRLAVHNPGNTVNLNANRNR